MNNIISIIIPTFNRANSLPYAVKSVLEQTAPNWELVIVDDGSTDDTQKILKEYLGKERINYHFQENSGVSIARNKGVELSRGDYVIFLDSDDHFYPDLISNLNEIKFENYDLICWQVSKIIDGKPSLWKPQKLEKIYNNIIASFLAGSICYKKDLLLKVGGFDPEMNFGENYELGIRISNLPGLRTKVIHQPFLVYSINSTDRTSSTNFNKTSSNLRLLRKHNDLYKKDRLSLSRLLYQVGFLYESRGKSALALSYYKRAVKIRPIYFKAFLKTFYLGITSFFKN
ncbi:MAG: glycosyltransferase [Salinimicrobium sp.]